MLTEDSIGAAAYERFAAALDKSPAGHNEVVLQQRFTSRALVKQKLECTTRSDDKLPVVGDGTNETTGTDTNDGNNEDEDNDDDEDEGDDEEEL